MSLREKINGNPAIAGIAVVVVILVAAWLGYRRLTPVQTVTADVFYTADDGKTWFAGDQSGISPIDHDGQKAYRAHVYQCGDDKPFVGFLERYPDDLRALLERFRTDPKSIKPNELIVLRSASAKREMKKPGETKWQPLNPAGVSITCPDGKAAKPVD